jgi:hypothetical protein
MADSGESRKAPTPQIGCNLPSAVVRELKDYAQSLSLSGNGLGRLLIQRELKSSRLPALVSKFDVVQVGDKAGQRVTVHITDRDLKSAYREHVQSLGLGSDQAAATLFVAELEERFLYGHFGWQENRP